MRLLAANYSFSEIGERVSPFGAIAFINSVKQRVNRSFSFTPMAYFYGRVVRNFFNQRACGFRRRRFFPSKFERFLGYCTQHQFAIAAALWNECDIEWHGSANIFHLGSSLIYSRIHTHSTMHKFTLQSVWDWLTGGCLRFDVYIWKLNCCELLFNFNNTYLGDREHAENRSQTIVHSLFFVNDNDICRFWSETHQKLFDQRLNFFIFLAFATKFLM